MVMTEEAVKSIIGRGSFICAKIGDSAENNLANTLQKPNAVAENKVGNRNEFAVKTI